MHLPLRPLLLLALPLALSACGPTRPAPADCSRFTFPLSPAVASPHVACNGTCGDGLSPPTSGPHCASTATCRVHDAPLSPCLWVHNLEHGHAVLLYNCPEGCPDVVATLEQLRNEAPAGGNGVRRALVAPAPNLPHRVAGLLWRRAWQGDSADPEALRCLLQLQDVDAPEPGLACLP